MRSIFCQRSGAIGTLSCVILLPGRHVFLRWCGFSRPIFASTDKGKRDMKLTIFVLVGTLALTGPASGRNQGTTERRVTVYVVGGIRVPSATRALGEGVATTIFREI